MEVAPSGLVLRGVCSFPRAVPWAGMGRPFRAGVAWGFGLMTPKAKDLRLPRRRSGRLPFPVGCIGDVWEGGARRGGWGSVGAVMPSHKNSRSVPLFRPEGADYHSPGQRPGNRGIVPEHPHHHKKTFHRPEGAAHSSITPAPIVPIGNPDPQKTSNQMEVAPSGLVLRGGWFFSQGDALGWHGSPLQGWCCVGFRPDGAEG